uniref:RH1 domain-containing protein n=1 Tax=Mesocestoides corti TaxID=53468 RepID=A0A5K3EWJ2_MESCO
MTACTEIVHFLRPQFFSVHANSECPIYRFLMTVTFWVLHVSMSPFSIC